jgi:hypothetical protein
MPAGRTLRFLGRFARPASDPPAEQELVLEVEGQARGATLYLPRGAGPAAGRRVAAWVLLPGVTVPGRHHAGVRRMARALASAGYLALVPEVPSWTALHVDPRQAAPTVRAALGLAGAHAAADSEHLGLMAFSVAGTWALELAAGDLGRRLRAVVSVGGYGDFRRLLVAMVTGEHEWRGRRYRYAPDPYGRWIMGADLLPRLAGTAYGTQEEREAAAGALHRLAHTAGRNGAMAGTPVYDPLIAHLRRTLPPGALAAWDLLAPPSENLVPDPAAGRALAGALAEAGLRALPELDPAGRLDGLAAGNPRGGRRLHVVLMHGREDTLIPFSETLRLATALPRAARRTVTITGIFGHAKAARVARHPVKLAYEAWRFAATVAVMLRSVEH